MKIPSRSLISKILILTGVLCVAGSVLYEALHYPWSTIFNKNVNEIELPDPPPLSIAYIPYTDEVIPDSDENESNISITPAQLPVDDFDIEADTVEIPLKAATLIPSESDVPVSVTPTEQPVKEVIPQFVLLGYVKIPRLNVSQNLLEGTENQMRYGIGHVEGTAMPGGQGNCAIAGHRSSSSGMEPFKYLDKMQNGDLITISFNDGIYTYEVIDMFIVSMYDTWVLEPVEDETHLLTIITCDPLISAGIRVDRLIIRARLTK